MLTDTSSAGNMGGRAFEVSLASSTLALTGYGRVVRESDVLSSYSHTEDMQLPYVLHYGKFRPTNLSQLENTAIVLTTYDTVSAEARHGLGSNRESTILFTVRWRRVILDEGTWPLYLPIHTYKWAEYLLTLLFTKHTSSAIAILKRLAQYALLSPSHAGQLLERPFKIT